MNLIMKKTLIYFSLFLFLGYSISLAQDQQKDNEYTLSGTVEGDYNDYIFLNYNGFKDSCKVVDQQFSFTGNIEKETQAWLNFRPSSTVAWIFLESSDIRIKTRFQQGEGSDGSAWNMISIEEIEGSETAKIEDRIKQFRKENSEKENYGELYYQELKEVFKENPQNALCGKLLSDQMTLPSLEAAQMEDLFSLLDTVRQQDSHLKEIDEGLKIWKRYYVGAEFTDLRLPTTADDTLALDAYKGKKLLIDFWASWCRPCRAKHPEMLALYENYAGDDFEIVGISTDDDVQAWKIAIEKDMLPWEQALDKGWDISMDLGVKAIPFNYLLDEGGKIAGINLSLKEVEAILKAQ